MNKVDNSSYYEIINSARYQAWVEQCKEFTGEDYTGYERSLFEEYLETELEYDVDNKYTSMDVDDLLSMEIKDGKLVDPNAEEKADGAKGKASAAEEAAPAAEEAAPAAEEAGEDNAQLYGNDPTIKMGEQPITDFINDLFGEEKYLDIIDTDKSGDISTEEAQAFINAIKGLDGDKENISLEDILEAMQDINNDEFTLDPEEVELKEEEIAEAKEAQQANAANGAGGVSGGGYGGGVAGNVTPQGVQEKTLDNMTKEELNAELSKAESDLSDKKEKLSAVLDGSDPELQKLKEAEDKAYETYQDELKNVDEEMAEQVDELKTSIDDKEAEIDAKEQEISDQKTVVSDCETAYNNAVTTTQTLETSLAALQSADTSDMDSEKQAELNSKIAELEAKIDEAKANEDKAKEEWDNAEEKLSDLEDEKDTLDGELDELNGQMTELEEQIAEKYPEVKEYMEAYKDAKKEYTDTKQEAITTAQNDIDESQEYVNEVKTAINNYDNKETAKEYSFGAFGEDILEFAKSFIGCNESDGSADKFVADWGTTSAATPWCAAFVDYVMDNFGGYENVPDWYKNIDNKWYCPNVYSAAQSAGAIIDVSQVQQGDIVLFDWNGGGSDHIGIIDRVENGVIYTIEGNTSNQVAQRTYNVGDSRLTFCKIVA